jgi:NADH-quinone oxidoreductase subunit L
MGGLRRYMPVTHLTFLIACLAIAGIPPFSGFFSKDEILATAFHADKVLFAVLWIVAGLTAFYMFRLYYTIFWGKEKQYEHAPHEAPMSMRLPLIVLAVFTCVTGFIPFPEFISSDRLPFAAHIDWGIAASGIAVALIGIVAATLLYRRGSEKPDRIAVHIAALHRFYLDEVWMFVTKSVIFQRICTPIAWFDKHVIDGVMNGFAGGTQRIASAINGLQSGKVQFYALVFVVGTLLISLWALFI